MVTAQERGRRGGRLEPRGGWRLGTKTSGSFASGPDEPLTPAEEARRDAADALRAKRRSDRLARQDVSDLELDRHHVVEGRSAFRTRESGQEPRSPFGGDPAEERRNVAKARRGESPSVWVQDSRAGYYRESWDEQQAERLANEGGAAAAALREAVRGGLEELVRVRTVVLADRFTASAAELDRLAARPRQEDDGRRANRLDRAAVVEDGLPLVPPLGPALVHVEADPALVALAAGRYSGAVLEPPLRPEWLAGPGCADVAADAAGVVERALDDVEAAHLRRWRDDPLRAAALERRWEAERDRLWDEASRSSAPEEARLLVEGMREYASGLAETVRGVRYVVRLHTALGRDPAASPLDPETLDRALEQYPDLLEGIRAADPDSPLLVVPAGLGAEYPALLGRAVDGVRPLVAAGSGDDVPVVAGSVRGRVSAVLMELVEARERRVERDADDRADRSPVGGPAGLVAEAAARGGEQRLAEADLRFGDLCDALEARGVRFEMRGAETGQVGRDASDAVVALSDDAFGVEARWLDGAPARCPLPVGSLDERRSAVAAALRGAAAVLQPREAGPVQPAVAERFGARLAARVFDEALSVPAAAPGAAEREASRLAAEIGSEARELGRLREERSAARAAALDRFEQVLDAVRGVVPVVVRGDDDGDGRAAAEYRVARDPASGALAATVVVDARYVEDDRCVSNAELAAGHGEAYVAIGRALGGHDAESRAEDWSKVYGAVASTAPAEQPAAVEAFSCAGGPAEHAALGRARAYAAALREQVRADAFATEQMGRTWPRGWREGTPRPVERAGGRVEISAGRLAELGVRRRVEHVLERDGRRLGEEIGVSIRSFEKLVRRVARGAAVPAAPDNPATPPAPALGAGEAPDRAVSHGLDR